jgi:hypothetical protein
MDSIKQAIRPFHPIHFAHLKEINWANGAAILIMVLYLLAITYSDSLQEIVKTIYLAPK